MWGGGKLIIDLSNNDLIRMVSMKKNMKNHYYFGEVIEMIFGQKIADTHTNNR